METSPEKPAPVRAIANAVSGWIDRLGAVWVEGQVAQVSRRPTSGTVFLTLRDSVADLSLTVTASRVYFDSLPAPIQEGASVVIHARPSYYATRGTFSLQAREIRAVGLGELMARIEQRRQLLAAEGLFDPARKRPLPFLPGAVGLVTSPGSAAERDVLENGRRRWPAVRFEVWGTDPGWNVETDGPHISNRVQASTEMQYEESDRLPSGTQTRVETAHDGFDVLIERRVYDSDGELIDELELFSQYQPASNRTLIGTGD
jgi:hypothetical protein